MPPLWDFLRRTEALRRDPLKQRLGEFPGICFGKAELREEGSLDHAECAGPRCLNSAAWSFTKSRMFVGASPVSVRMASVIRS
jgi:hypothetical protein